MWLWVQHCYPFSGPTLQRLQFAPSQSQEPLGCSVPSGALTSTPYRRPFYVLGFCSKKQRVFENLLKSISSGLTILIPLNTTAKGGRPEGLAACVIGVTTPQKQGSCTLYQQPRTLVDFRKLHSSPSCLRTAP